MEYVKAAQTTEMAPGNKKKIVLKNKEILLANIDGAYYAVDNKCPHMGGSLYDGKLDGNNIICPRHGSIFDVKTGKAVHGGKLLLFHFEVRDIAPYPVKVVGTDIFIEIE